MQDVLQKGYIYTLSCPLSGLVRYVGQTVDVQKRFALHLFHSKNGRATTYKEKWINSLINDNRKPVLEIVWEGNAVDLDKKEFEFIALYKAFGAKLTNATMGGTTTRGRKCSAETKQKFRDMFKGVCLRPPISEAEKIATGNRNRGKKHSEEFKKKISEARKGKSSYWTHNEMPESQKDRLAKLNLVRAKPIIAIKDGIETRYDCTMDAERSTGCNRKTMRLVARGEYKQCKGYVFKYAQT